MERNAEQARPLGRKPTCVIIAYTITGTQD